MRLVFSICTLAALAPAAYAGNPDDDFVAAHEAYRLQDLSSLETYAATLKGYLLEDYAQFWYLDTKLARQKEADSVEIRQFLKRFAYSPLADRLRAQWLKFLGKNEDWETFGAEYPQLTTQELEITCYALHNRLRKRDPQVSKEAWPLWFTGKVTPESCDVVFEGLIHESAITEEDIWARLRLALEANNVELARQVNSYLPSAQSLPEKLLDAAAAKPDRFLEHHGRSLKSRAGRELTIFALRRIARNEPQEAVDDWQKLLRGFDAKDQEYVWGQLAIRAALNHDPDALSWFAKAKSAALSDQQLEWKARSALRARNWGEVLAAIDSLSEADARDTTWRYWKARALTSQGRSAEANAYLGQLAKEFNFYGVLAAEELGIAGDYTAQSWKASPDDLIAMQSQLGIHRALALNRLRLEPEGKREWLWAIRGFDDKQLLTAAEVARRAEWYDRAIGTAEKTVNLHDFGLRYPVPYREALQEHARQYRLDEAWIYGLVRQESHFYADARSRSGALGLMQLMPATAAWAARKLGMTDFNHALTNEMDLNLTLGTFYLRTILDDVGDPVVATAAYNAGPNRARRWVDEKPMEGAIFAETIPLAETRDYVKKVMANAVIYARRLGLNMASLKERLGIVGQFGPRPDSQTQVKGPAEPGQP